MARSYINPDGGDRRFRNILSLDDFEGAARRYLPGPVFGYVSGAAEENRALAGNREAFTDYDLVPRVLRDVSSRSLETELLGETWSAPFGMAPVALAALAGYRGDVSMARAAAAAGIPSVLSGSSLTPLEEVAAAAPAKLVPGLPPRR